MNITYEKIFSILNSKFHLVKGEKKNYFLDNSQRIVATVDENSITMYYDFPKHSREIWNHYGNVAIVFARNFNVNGQICDVLCVDGLCGACNDFIVDANFSINMINNSEMRYLLDNDKNSLQKQFESLNYKEKISVLEKLTGANFTGAQIKGVQLFADSDKYKLGNCGKISSNNGIVSFDICGEVEFDNVVANNQEDGYDINIVNFKNEYQKVNYEEVYSFYRQKNDWHYNSGYKTAGSKETRAFTERRKYSTTDAEAIHLPISIQKLDEIYENGKQSLNAKRLQMLYTLNSLINDKKKSLDYVSSHYDFNIRNCDLIKQKVKK